MKLTLILLAASLCAFAQQSGNVMFQSGGPAGAMAWGFEKGPATVVKGAPYSATMNNESVQTLADGNRVVQTTTGTVLRDSQGRTRQDAALPAIGNLSAASAPHLVFIQDPVAGTSYTLNLTEKTAWKNPPPPPGKGGPGVSVGSGTFVVHTEGGMPPFPPPPPPPMMAQTKHLATDEQLEANTESLGSQTLEGVAVNGVRTTRTIPAGQVGNDRPISIVTEVWTSADLKTIVSSKRNDPRMGEQTFRLTNIVRAEPDPSLFAVPSDFRIIDGGPKTIIYRRSQ
jgi:hypothetical protein